MVYFSKTKKPDLHNKAQQSTKITDLEIWFM